MSEIYKINDILRRIGADYQVEIGEPMTGSLSEILDNLLSRIEILETRADGVEVDIDILRERC